MARAGGFAEALREELRGMGVEIPGPVQSQNPTIESRLVNPFNPVGSGGGNAGEDDSSYYYEYEDESESTVKGSQDDQGPGSQPPPRPPPKGDDDDLVTDTPPAIEILPFVPMAAVRMTFEGFTMQELRDIPGAGAAFCIFFR
jgi:hypothetical protein